MQIENDFEGNNQNKAGNVVEKIHTTFETLELLLNWNPKSEKGILQIAGEPTVAAKKPKKTSNHYAADHMVYVQEVKKGLLIVHQQCKLSEHELQTLIIL